MTEATLRPIAEAVTRRAQRQGYVTARDVRAELTLAGLPAECWKQVVALARPALSYRQGRYYPVSAVSSRAWHEQEQQRLIAKAVRRLIRQHRAAVKRRERRGQARSDFIHPVTVYTDDGKILHVLSRDLSPTGIRLIGTCQLLGQKVRIEMAAGDETVLSVCARILWTCAVGDGLFENGGSFLALASG
ncbi:MAG: PilZ domain-containing protein [Gemmataceae bacterium]|nr:PilZ domain-containing protein [Gemmataceae bacterium]